MELRDFLAMECPFLLPWAGKGMAALLAEIDRACAGGDSTLWPGTTAGEAAGGSLAALREQVEGYFRREELRADRKSTRLNSSHIQKSRMPSSA